MTTCTCFAARRRRTGPEKGISLVEALVATVILMMVAAGVVPLVVAATRSTRHARETGTATWLARQKLEELRGLAFTRTEGGVDVTDTTSHTGVDPVAAVGGTGLQPSPADALQRDVAGYVDHVDDWGRKVRPPAPFTRRWRIEAVGGPDLLRLLVRVHHVRQPGAPVLLGTLRGRRMQ